MNPYPFSHSRIINSQSGGTTMAGPGACYTDADLEAKKKDTIYHQVLEFLDKGETVAVATIVSTKGSTPREVGAKMVVTAWGGILGTTGRGGGAGGVEAAGRV